MPNDHQAQAFVACCTAHEARRKALQRKQSHCTTGQQAPRSFYFCSAECLLFAALCSELRNAHGSLVRKIPAQAQALQGLQPPCSSAVSSPALVLFHLPKSSANSQLNALATKAT